MVERLSTPLSVSGEDEGGIERVERSSVVRTE